MAVGKERNNHARKEGGVEIVELALIMPVLILICFGVIDLLRISYFESMLQRAAADIAVAARSAPNLDFDLRDFENTNRGEFNDFRVARERALNARLANIAPSFTEPAVPSAARLIATSQRDNALNNYNGAAPDPYLSSAIILRPGEEATFSYTDDRGDTKIDLVKHPLIPSDGGPSTPGRVPPQRMEKLLDLAPLHVEIRAQVKPLLWAILGTRIVKGVATTYREKGIRRVVMVDNAGVDMAGPTATRRGTGPNESWLTSPEPVEMVATCAPRFGPPPYTAGQWRLAWVLALARSTMFEEAVVLQTKSPLALCPPTRISLLGSPLI